MKLANEYCQTCKVECLHRLGICIGCGTEQPWRAKREVRRPMSYYARGARGQVAPK